MTSHKQQMPLKAPRYVDKTYAVNSTLKMHLSLSLVNLEFGIIQARSANILKNCESVDKSVDIFQ